MPDPMPNCVVDVQFDAGATPPFSFACSSSTRGWQVFSNGGIYPAILGRRVQFRVKDYPDVRIAGFQISAEELGALPPSDHWPELPPGDAGVKPVPADSHPLPGSNDTRSELTLDLGLNRWFYRLAVVVDGDLVWDDPKIHDDGSA